MAGLQWLDSIIPTRDARFRRDHLRTIGAMGAHAVALVLGGNRRAGIDAQGIVAKRGLALATHTEPTISPLKSEHGLRGAFARLMHRVDAAVSKQFGELFKADGSAKINHSLVDMRLIKSELTLGDERRRSMAVDFDNAIDRMNRFLGPDSAEPKGQRVIEAILNCRRDGIGSMSSKRLSPIEDGIVIIHDLLDVGERTGALNANQAQLNRLVVARGRSTDLADLYFAQMYLNGSPATTRPVASLIDGIVSTVKQQREMGANIRRAAMAPELS